MTRWAMVDVSDVPAQAWPRSPGFGWLRLYKIVSWAQSQKCSLAWLGFGLGQGL